MFYKKTEKGIFLSRPNRFIAKVLIGGREETVHVCNTGRCRELLVEGAEVILAKGESPHRKTAYDLVAVKKGGTLINMDSQAPNKAVEEFIRSGRLFGDIEAVLPERVYGSSRFDFYGVHGGREFFAEVKGVTLESGGIAAFPDAPTQRGRKHLQELAKAAADGYECCIIFVVQMKGVSRFQPNFASDAGFAAALREASAAGVKVLCYDCLVSESGMELADPVEICLDLSESAAEFSGDA